MSPSPISFSTTPMPPAACSITTLCQRAQRLGLPHEGLLELHNLVMLTDDVDRWVLAIDGSRELALAVRTMKQEAAFQALSSMGPDLAYGPELLAAAGRVQGALDESLELAEATLHTEAVDGSGVTVVSAECNGYAGEVAYRWSQAYRNTVFALADRLGGAISLRRTVDCEIDLSRLAAVFGGGGHPAAAGCDMGRPPDAVSATVARKLAHAVARQMGKETERELIGETVQ